MAIWITLWLFKLIESLPSKRIISIHPLFFLAMFRPSPERRGPAPGYLQPVDRFPHQPATWQRCAREMSAHVGHFETSRIPKKKSIHSGIVCLFLRFFFPGASEQICDTSPCHSWVQLPGLLPPKCVMSEEGASGGAGRPWLWFL